MGGVVCSGIKERLERNERVSRPRGTSLERGRGSRKSEDERSYSLIDLFSKSVDSSGFSIVVGICITKRIFLCLRFTHGEHGRYHADHEYGLSVPATGFLFEEVRERICLL